MPSQSPSVLLGSCKILSSLGSATSPRLNIPSLDLLQKSPNITILGRSSSPPYTTSSQVSSITRSAPPDIGVIEHAVHPLVTPGTSCTMDRFCCCCECLPYFPFVTALELRVVFAIIPILLFIYLKVAYHALCYAGVGNGTCSLGYLCIAHSSLLCFGLDNRTGTSVEATLFWFLYLDPVDLRFMTMY